MDFLADHPYLVVSVAMTASCLVGTWLVPAQRRATILSGLLCLPYGFASPLFVPEYWQPKRVAAVIAGPEDLLFSFAAGGLVWLIAAVATGRPQSLDLRVSPVVGRYLLWSGAFFGLVLGLRAWWDMRTMPAVLVSGLVLALALLRIRRDMWKLAVCGSLGYGLMYFLICSLTFQIWPEVSDQWSWQNLTGYALLGVPIEEHAYALVFGASWALFMAYIFGARWTTAPSRVSDLPAQRGEAA